MSDYETKLKLGRKLDGSADVGSANQVSVLFRVDEAGNDTHVSVSIESDAMGPDDVVELLKVLEQRGLFSAKTTKTWLSQPASSEAKFGKTTVWQGKNLQEVVQLLSLGLSVRTGAAPAASAESAGDAARLKAAQLRVLELERALAELKKSLQ